jgi:serine phosphatase RsbU (regulator of sigma subunit)
VKGTTLLNNMHEQPQDENAVINGPDPDGVPAFQEDAAVPRSRHLAVGPAADVIGTVLDLHMTGDHVVHAMAPGFCDAASVYLLERWLVDETAGAPADPPQVEARRLALRMGTQAFEQRDGDPVLPVGEVVVFPRHTPYARALATGHSQVLDAVDAHTSERLAASGRGDLRIDDLLRSASFLVVPLLLQGTAIGFIACTRGTPRPPFGLEDTAGVESLAARAAVALDNARRYEHERRTAQAIRRSLLPSTGRSFDGCRVALGYRPAGQTNIIGGDWFGVLPRPGGQVGLIVGDAMGHGPEAAVAMIQLRTAARTLAGLDTTPEELLRHLDTLAADTPGASFATCVYAEWDPEQHTCTLAGAGHPPPLLLEADAPARPTPLGAGLPLGLGAWTGEPTVLKIHQPTLLLLYSDGLVESRHCDIDTGITRLAQALDTAATGWAPGAGQEALQSLCDRLWHDAPGDATADDQTLLLAELTPAHR